MEIIDKTSVKPAVSAFDFDEWMALASADPAEFERRRDELVDRTCEMLGGKDVPYIAGILCRIELERGRGRSPMQRCLRLSALMWDRLLDLDYWLMTCQPRRLSGKKQDRRLARLASPDAGRKQEPNPTRK